MIVQAENLCKAFRGHEALRGLSFAVPEGSAYALIGANGAGKTTTIKILMNLIEASSGTANLLGVDSRHMSIRELAQIGYVSENQEMPGRLTVAQYVDYLRPLYPTWDHSLEQSVLRELRLPMDRKIRDLSHGMRLKMALACALPFRPKLLVLDEPFSGLDSLVRDEFMERLLDQAGELTILISSHELDEIQGVVTDIAFIDQGRLLFQESMAALSDRVRDVRITFDAAPALPHPVPEGWLQMAVTGNVLTFVDTQFSDERLTAIASALFKGIRNVDVQPIALRNIFTALARAARDGG
jgi:ABC-2 type transport system ATP-binding protein